MERVFGSWLLSTQSVRQPYITWLRILHGDILIDWRKTMAKYDIQDAYKLKVFMQEIQTIVDKYGANNMWSIKDTPKDIKEAIEWIGEMVEKGV